MEKKGRREVFTHLSCKRNSAARRRRRRSSCSSSGINKPTICLPSSSSPSIGSAPRVSPVLNCLFSTCSTQITEAKTGSAKDLILMIFAAIVQGYEPTGCVRSEDVVPGTYICCYLKGERFFSLGKSDYKLVVFFFPSWVV